LAINRHITVCVSGIVQKAAIRRADKVIVFSENMRRQVADLLAPVVIRDLSVVPPGVDGVRFSRDDMIRNEMRKAFGVGDKWVFLCLGRLVEIKGYADVIAAFACLPPSIRSECCVFIVGSGAAEQDLRAEAVRWGVADDVRFCGPTLEPERYYALGDCFMMTSRYEAFGQTLLEAVASELVVIAYESDEVAIRTASSEVLQDVSSAFFARFSRDDLAAVMERVVSQDRNRLKYLCMQSARLLRSRHCWSRIVVAVTSSRTSALSG
jgi:glycosyltransferase involved in cell wall biosynthesis